MIRSQQGWAKQWALRTMAVLALAGALQTPCPIIRNIAEAKSSTDPAARPARPYVRVAEGEASPQAAGGAPGVISLRGIIGGRQIDAVLTRTGPRSWEWRENGATFHFNTVLDAGRQLVIYDGSRGMYHKLNLTTGQTAWRVSKLKGGDGTWKPHYGIIPSN